jgi:hypothetical protein
VSAGTGPTRMAETEAWQDLARHDQGAAQADADADLRRGGHDYPHTHTGNAGQERMIEATKADLAALQSSRQIWADQGNQARVAECDEWIPIAEEDHAAAVAGIDYRDLAEHFGPESVATADRAAAYWPCGYPETHTAQLAQAEQETGMEAGQ